MRNRALEQRYCSQRLRFPSSKYRPQSHFSILFPGLVLSAMLSAFCLRYTDGFANTWGAEIPIVIWDRRAHTLIVPQSPSFLC